jgi:hypothetical protein
VTNEPPGTNDGPWRGSGPGFRALAGASSANSADSLHVRPMHVAREALVAGWAHAAFGFGTPEPV